MDGCLKMFNGILPDAALEDILVEKTLNLLFPLMQSHRFAC
jgi:hypothetical protein